jgi:hypothetical protein
MAAKKKAADAPAVLPSRRDDLIVMRQRLVAAMFEAEPNVLAQLVGQLRAVVKELDELPEAQPESSLARALAVREKRLSGLKAV